MRKTIFAIVVTALLTGASWAQDAAPESNPFPTAPPPATPRLVTVPPVVDTKLPNGLRVLTVSRPGSGLVNVQLLIRSGTADDPVGKSGRGRMLTNLLTKGTKTRSATQIADAIEQVGASLGADAGYDRTTVTLSVLKSRLPTALPIFADVVQNPTFPVEELNRQRAETLDDLSVAYREPGTLARLVAARTLYGDTPYGKPASGTPETLREIGRTDLSEWHRSRFQPANAVLVISGDVTAEAGKTIATRYLGAWKNTGTVPPPRLAAVLTPGAKRRIVVVDRPDAGQAAVYVNRFGVKQGEPDPVIGELTNDILGGGYSARLNREVRVKRGLSYGANSALDPRQEVGPLVLATQTKNETAGEAARVLVDELARLGTEPPTPEEFAARKSALSGDFARSLETGGGLAGLIAELAFYNRPLAELQTYLAQIQAVTPEQIQGFAKERLDAATANVVIVGNAAQFLPDLKTRFPGETITVIPFANLDLNRADLMKARK